MRFKLTPLLLFLLVWVSGFSQTAQLLKRAGTASNYPGAGVLVVYDSTKVNVQETGLSHYNFARLYKVLTAEGAKTLSVVKFDYDPLTAFVRIERVRIYRANGSVEELSADRVHDYPAPARAIYWGARQKMVDIGRLEPGDGLEVIAYKKGFSYALLTQQELSDEYYIPPMRGHFYDIVEFFSASDPIKEKVYTISIAADKNLQYQVYNGIAATKERNVDGMVEYSFSVKDIIPFKREQRMVALSDVAPKLLMSTSPDWYAKSKWFYGVNEDFGSFDSTPEIDKKVKEILRDAKTEMDSISLLNHWVADEIRYSGLSMGKGEGFTLHKSAMTFSDRCGVCKDKAGMLVTMLRSAGFKSYAAMTMAGSRIDRIPADQFNHSVTVVQRKNGEYMLLDPTWVPFVREEWSSREQQQNYLMGLPEGADLMETPISAPENHYFKITGTSKILADGTLDGEFTLTAEGQSDAAVRGIFTRAFREDWLANLQRELLKVSPRARFMEVTYTDPYQYLKQPVSITIKYQIPQYAVVTSKEVIFVPLLAANLFGSRHSHLAFNTSTEKRSYPFTDGCSKLIELEESIALPHGLNLTYAPQPASVKGTGADFSVSYTKDGDKLLFKQMVSLKKRVYQPEDWASFRDAVKAQNECATKPVILKF